MYLNMKVLLACEESQAVTKEFRELGHEAYSCDLLPCSGGHPEWHLQQDVTELLKENWDLIIAFPPCFVEGTLILTNSGYRAIEDIQIGDVVLTHTGSWKKVTKTMNKRVNKVRFLKTSNNIETITTDEHPYYVRSRSWKTERIGGKIINRRTDKIPEWKEAKDLNGKDFTGSILPPVVESNYTDKELWLMGRYVADGHIRKHRKSEGKYENICVSVGKHKIDYFLKHAVKPTSINEERTVFKCNYSGDSFCQKFSQFGFGAENKELPAWVLSLPYKQAKVFLDGYLSGDGHISDNIVSASTISKKLILGLYILFCRVFVKKNVINAPTIMTPSKRTVGTIEGRIVNMKPLYSISININPTKSKTYFDHNNSIAWAPVRVNKSVQKDCTVYNLSVEDDESYIANGVIVHNCTLLTVTGNRWFNIDKYGDKARKRIEEREEAIKFFMLFANANCEHVAIENPVGIISTVWRKPDQIIQPYMFGDEFEKKTCLWLKGLPKLKPTNIVTPPPRLVFDSGKSMPSWYSDAWKLPKEQRSIARSKTFPGIAKAMAEQWSDYLINKKLF